jgi:hypothetical protein
MMDELKQSGTLNEFWRDLTPEQQESSMDKIVMTFDLKNNEVNMHSDSKNSKGDPMFEWNLNPVTGDIVESTRKADATSEKIIERQISPASLHNDEIQHAIERIEATKPASYVPVAAGAIATASGNIVAKDAVTQESSATAAPIDWDSLDMQRDLAFKIVYFFIVFIVATFGLLYAYFQMNQKELEDE